ncbi:hypothetical protein MtrunA17_Chr7g0267621 [Medicago truncatula]|uniref:Transmembrane protein n=1 Tax=Medicago truncatula TaxID=3880 RepID=A0A396H6B7_MEDTR|nr:hypothetical protein MtrunA17_Chr7g0267621 [Medicago truncatula]
MLQYATRETSSFDLAAWCASLCFLLLYRANIFYLLPVSTLFIIGA